MNCYEICPQGAIGLNHANEIIISSDRCNECGKCVKECPSNAITITSELELPVDPKTAKLPLTDLSQTVGRTVLPIRAEITKGREQSAIVKPAGHTRYSSAFSTRYGTYRATIDVPIELTQEAKERPRKRLGDMVRVSQQELGPLSVAFEKIGTAEGLTKEQLAEVVLNFVQAIPFVTDKTAVSMPDYHSYPAETLAIGIGDCEDLSIIAAATLRNLSYDVVLLNPIGHIAIGVTGEFKGYKVDYEGKSYYYGEPTVPGWHLGEMPAEFIDKEINVIEV